MGTKFSCALFYAMGCSSDSKCAWSCCISLFVYEVEFIFGLRVELLCVKSVYNVHDSRMSIYQNANKKILYLNTNIRDFLIKNDFARYNLSKFVFW